MNYNTGMNHQTTGKNPQGYQWGSFLWDNSATGFDQWQLASSIHPLTSNNPKPSLTWKGEQLVDHIPVGLVMPVEELGFSQPQGFLALSPWILTGFPAQECLVSWNTQQTEDLVVSFWLQIVQPEQPEQPWFCLGEWTSDPKGPRGSVKGQSWQGSKVLTDTLRAATPFSQMRVGIEVKNRTTFEGQSNLKDQSWITLNAIQLTWSQVLLSDPSSIAQVATPLPEPHQPPQPPRTPKAIQKPWYLSKLPACSQMVYPDGGSVWCSPVSLAMVLEYWEQSGKGCKEVIFPTRDGVYDPIYQGYGNWVFNMAWAGQLGYRARVLRAGTLSNLEPWLYQGIPLILSVAWNQEKGPVLAGAPIQSSNGHLTVLAGFDEQGNPIIHEPASASDQEVIRTYQRDQLEQCWLQNSGGTFYAVYPESITTPW